MCAWLNQVRTGIAWVEPQVEDKIFHQIIQEIAECLQQNAKSEKATAFLIWKALLFSVALTTISEHLILHYFTVANTLQSPVVSTSPQRIPHTVTEDCNLQNACN